MEIRIFIASSCEGLDIAEALRAKIETRNRNIWATVWHDKDVFRLSKDALNSLVNMLNKVDFGIFVFSPDDALLLRGEQYSTVRDNVLFELGMFIGRLGANRNFVLTPDRDKIRIPTDLTGFTLAQYNSDRIQYDGIQGAIGTPSEEIYKEIMSIGPIAKASLNNADQSCAFCYRIKNGNLEVLLVRTNKNRWIYPKSKVLDISNEIKVAENAAKMEAGVYGSIDNKELTRFSYYKEGIGTTILISAFLLRVEREHDPIEDFRCPTWFTAIAAQSALTEGRDDYYANQICGVIKKAQMRIRGV